MIGSTLPTIALLLLALSAFALFDTGFLLHHHFEHDTAAATAPNGDLSNATRVLTEKHATEILEMKIKLQEFEQKLNSQSESLRALEKKVKDTGNRATKSSGESKPEKKLESLTSTQTFIDPKSGLEFLTPGLSVNTNGSLMTLPSTKSTRDRSTNHSILVVYSGPTDLVKDPRPMSQWEIPVNKNMLYLKNFEHFLKYGVQCLTQDTVIVLTQEVKSFYQAQLTQMDKECQEQHGHRVFVLERENICYDMESLRLAFASPEIQAAEKYDYLFYVNCGTTGPSRDWAEFPWTDAFLDRFSPQIRMTGLSMVCSAHKPHIQSMMFAVDRVGIQIIKDIPFKCMDDPVYVERLSNRDQMVQYLVNMYERTMGSRILKGGYAIQSLLQDAIITDATKKECQEGDIWLSDRFKARYGRIPFLNETIFFKTSRVLSPETAKEIGYQGKIDWNW